jgi:hypothetical protein
MSINKLRNLNESPTIQNLAVKLGACTGYNFKILVNWAGLPGLHFIHEGHPTLRGAYVSFSICPTWDMFYVSYGTHRGYLSGKDLRDIEGYLRAKEGSSWTQQRLV